MKLNLFGKKLVFVIFDNNNTKNFIEFAAVRIRSDEFYTFLTFHEINYITGLPTGAMHLQNGTIV